jgi:hypothetical protein
MGSKCYGCDSRLYPWATYWVGSSGGPKKICGACLKEFKQGAFQNTLAPEAEVTPVSATPVSLEDLIWAQDRTTHAVRSIAITFVAAPIVSALTFVVVRLAANSGNSELILSIAIGGGLVILGTLFLAIEELKLSKK